MLRDGSKSFHAAAQLLPVRVRQSATVFYAFCRLADDGVDHASDSAEALHNLRDRLDRAYAQTPLDQPVDRALADLVVRHHLPCSVFDCLFEGFEWDAAGRRYETLSDVRAYGVRVAGTVGVMMALLMGTRDPAALARACDLGVAMQLTNIARDVGEDANAARLYLPRAWFWEEGVDPDAWLARPEMQPALGRIVARLLAEADRLYRRSEPGIRALPVDCRAAIFAARFIYAGIGRRIAAADFNSVNARAYVPKGRKLALIGRSLLAARVGGVKGLSRAPLPEAVPLIASIEAHDAARPEPDSDALGRIFAMFDRLNQRDRLLPSRS